MRALVTGGTGFVGSHVARKLLEHGYEVRALVRRTSRIDNLADLDIEPMVGDLLEPDSLRTATEGCDLVFHVAADYRLWSPNPRSMYHSNVEGTLEVLRASLDAGVKRVVYTSTVGALGIPANGVSGNEDTIVTIEDMVGHYKRSKFQAEEEAKSFAEKTGLDLVIVNPSTPVGEMDIKPTPTGKIIVDFLNRRIPAFVDTGLNLIDVHDVAEGHLLAAERGIAGRRYILGNSNLTLQQILAELGDITGMKAPKRQIPYSIAYAAAAIDTAIWGSLLKREPHIPLEGVKMARKKMFFDSSRAISELGLPQSSVREALQRAVEWFRENGYAKA